MKTKIAEEISYKMIFWPEHAGDISFVYLVNQIFEYVSDIFANRYQKM